MSHGVGAAWSSWHRDCSALAGFRLCGSGIRFLVFSSLTLGNWEITRGILSDPSRSLTDEDRVFTKPDAARGRILQPNLDALTGKPR